jgi:ABC-type branched-subunit amino acid transport system substrate-binding protein
VSLPIVESVTGPNNILQISPASTSVALIEAADNDFFFRTTISDLAQGQVLATLAEEEGLTSVCTMFVNNPYGEGLSELFKEGFEDAGFTVPAEVPHEEELTTYASELDTCTAEGPDALAAIAYPESAGVFLREALERGDVDTFLFVDGTKSDAMFAELGWPDALDGMRGTAPGFLPPGEAALAFDAAFEAEYGEVPPLPFLRETYDAVYLIALAAETAGSTDPTAIRDALRGVAGPAGEIVAGGPEGYAAALALIADGSDINYEGAAGPVDFDEVGDVLLGAIETWHVDAANETFVTDDSFQVDLTTGEVTKIE